VIGELDARIPEGPLADKWDNHRFHEKLVAPANRRRYTVIVVGTGLAGASGMPNWPPFSSRRSRNSPTASTSWSAASSPRAASLGRSARS